MDLEKYLLYLDEAYGTSTVKRKKLSKLHASAGSIAFAIAKKNNDPLYRKMKFHKDMYKKTKKQLQQKYKTKANQLARERAASYKLIT
jgi:hypothetical protein